ncbi:MAG: hypothetical protein ACXACH_04790 [Candidatus Hermodarchaeia archaeon]|jgi:hypothetical protein
MSRDDFSSQQFSFLIFVLVVALTLVTAFSFLTNTLWVIGISTPWVLGMPVWYYIDARVKRYKFAKFVWMFLFIFTMNTIFNYFGPQWDPYPHFIFAIIQYVIAFVLFLILSTSLCERYLKPKLEESKTDI